MQLYDLFILAVGLSMDAFAVSICKGLSVQRAKTSHCASAGLYFGGFQALMPLIGFYLGVGFSRYIQAFDHWIAFLLLALIGANMIKESFGSPDEQCSSFSPSAMLPLAVATSIDALIVGVTFAFLDANIWFAISFIGITTFIFSFAGIKIGNIFGTNFKSKAELLGGIVLILMGLKILLEHLGVF